MEGWVGGGKLKVRGRRLEERWKTKRKDREGRRKQEGKERSRRDRWRRWHTQRCDVAKLDVHVSLCGSVGTRSIHIFQTADVHFKPKG